MNFKKIVQQEGYRYEDLTKEHKIEIDGLRWLQEDFESFEDNLDVYCDMYDDDSILSKIEFEIAKKVIDGVKLWIDSYIDECQVSLADSEEREENEQLTLV